jgi:hypothetical protein
MSGDQLPSRLQNNPTKKEDKQFLAFQCGSRYEESQLYSRLIR